MLALLLLLLPPPKKSPKISPKISLKSAPLKSNPPKPPAPPAPPSKYIVPLKDDIDSAFMAYFGVLNCNTDEFVVSHELGHSMDSYLKEEYQQMKEEIKSAQEKGEEIPQYLKNPLADNPQFMKEYVQEKAAFIKAFPAFKEDYIDYFLFETQGQNDRGRKETIAETNAINSQKPIPPEILAMRTQVLQQYFPRTIAVATKLTTPIAIVDNKTIFL